MKIAVFRTAHFNAAHRLHNPSWSDERNVQEFGVCNNPHYHGHNYELEVRLAGEVGPETGYLINLDKLKSIIEADVIQYLDHKNLNLEIDEFRTLNPTVENICYIIWSRLRKALDNKYELRVRLYETPRNYAEYPV
ncbi:MAG TPA: 6-carboxytetrahydropterin synthase [Saprospiraceae bacterium]|nr:6-carboxytetrahydropterin synthase [Saprospiraceae bacterium]